MLKRPQAHPEAKKWQNTPFPLYNEFHALIEGRHATGERAYRVPLTGDSDNKNNDATPTEDIEDSDSVIVTLQLSSTAGRVS